MTIVLDKKEVEKLEEWFGSYVQQFKSGDPGCLPNVVLKEKHTKRVCKEILGIGKEIGLNEQDLCLAEIIALFHDIGRFEQYARYHTFVDRDSVNHAALSVDIIKKNGVLDDIDESTRDLILRSILYHNRFALPEKETKRCLFFAKLLRDADKLDIWRVVTDYYKKRDKEQNTAIELGLPDTTEISDEVNRDLMEGRIVDVAHLKNLNDFKLLQCGWVYDINFVQTLRRVKERGYLEMIREVLPKTEKIAEIFSVLQAYMDRQIQKKGPEISTVQPGL
ncbi:MAG: HD domain-containing protein [Nitrospiraceae bacterium]|nr:HD domain-containing protein [Nitrospiraceae bacterium]